MTLSPDVKDREFRKFEEVSGEVAVRTKLVGGDIQIGAVEIKDGTTDTRAVVKNDGTDNALVVTMNTIPDVTISGDVNVTQGTTPWTVDCNDSNVNVTNMIPAVETGLIKESTTPLIYNITLTNANTEYSQALSENTKRFTMQCRTAFDVRFAFEADKVATPTAPYATMKASNPYTETSLNLTSKTIYLASATAGVIVEIVEWT